jgi:hypothetical protein
MLFFSFSFLPLSEPLNDMLFFSFSFLPLSEPLSDTIHVIFAFYTLLFARQDAWGVDERDALKNGRLHLDAPEAGQKVVPKLLQPHEWLARNSQKSLP